MMKTRRSIRPAVSNQRVKATISYLEWFLCERGCTDYEDVAARAVSSALHDIDLGYSDAEYFEFMSQQRAKKHAQQARTQQLRMPLSPQPIEELYEWLNARGLTFHSAAEAYFAAEAQNVLIEAIYRLPRHLRFVILNLLYYGYKQEEAAAKLKVSIRTIRRYEIKALTQLAEDDELRAYFHEYQEPN